ncbi:MAG: xanthine dehydrogenase accessory protein XdhC [Burkholderiales bacterium]|nr:xanthine dehydrogenase accessory protein XdhC [Burkholderiales bacterium]
MVSAFLQRLTQQAAVLVSVQASRGSVPREVGAWMAVFADAAWGTVGGGRLEHDALAHARQLLARGTAGGDMGAGAADADGVGGGVSTVRYALGPSLGQCCGGTVTLRFERVAARDAPALAARLHSPRMPVALFGGGHVGHALVQVLAMLPMDVLWFDSRDGVFPAQCPQSVQCEHADPVQSAVPSLPAGTRVLIMSFSHAEDLDIVAACLARQRTQGDLPYVGLIGSRTKWAAFRSRLAARGFTDAELAHVTCPIGVPGITDKRPEVIAVAVAAQLLQTVGVGWLSVPPSRVAVDGDEMGILRL